MKLQSLLLLGIIFICSACVSQKIQKEVFYGLWKVASIETAEQSASGEAMGNPQYEFTATGKRVKTLNTIPAPPPDTIAYELKNGVVSYPNNPKLPSMNIVYLSKDSLVLQSEKALWRLYK